jgi:excisionase family DNA binding protein
MADPATRLAVRPTEAAKLLGISVRLLRDLTNKSDLPCVRLGRCVLYRPADLDAWLAERSREGVANG